MLQDEIEVQMAKLNVLKSQSVSSSKSDRSRGKHSSLEQKQRKMLGLNASAKAFVPQRCVSESFQDRENTGAKPKEKTVQHKTLQSYQVEHQSSRHQTEEHRGQRNVMNSHVQNSDEQGNILGIMRKQSEITSLLLKQQCLSSLPKRDLEVFDGNPLQYHAFIRAFENSVESKTENNSARLYYLEQCTMGPPRELVQSCQYIDPNRGYVRAKVLLQEHFGNEQKVASAYMNKALSWPQIKTEDVDALQEYTLFLRGCSNVMNEVQYMCDLDIPSNMMIIIKKMPYRLRDKWRTVCELQERSNCRASFTDVVKFLEHQVKIITDPVFGNIQDVPSYEMRKNVKRSKLFSRPGIRGTSFATTVDAVKKESDSCCIEKKDVTLDKKRCLCCNGAHTLEVCPQFGKQSHKEKIGFLKESEVCFGCLGIGHISKTCRKRLHCDVCGLRHPTVLHIFSKENNTGYNRQEVKNSIRWCISI